MNHTEHEDRLRQQNKRLDKIEKEVLQLRQNLSSIITKLEENIKLMNRTK